jgi:CDP-glycerol glycerophosphotransferase (TagB/SpsB family)
MIHFRHGAGDRAPSSERRLKAFDLIVVPGEKDRERAHLAQGIPLDRIKVTGYVKLDWISRQGDQSPRLFDNERPTIVYNPHFDARISSWPQAESILALFAAQDQYNLIFAPHIRLSEGMSPAERKRWQSLAIPDKMLVDLGSVRLLDTSYLRAADIYLGDMSSQLYEFLANPRPAVFLNSHRVAWHGNPRYSGWALGEVAEDPAELLTAVAIAIERQASRVEAQKSAIKYAFGDYEGAARRGAAIVAETIDAPPLPRIRRIAVS